MHKTRRKYGGNKWNKLKRGLKKTSKKYKNNKKLMKVDAKISDINDQIMKLRIKARNIEDKLTSNTANTPLKKKLKREQGDALQKMKSLNNSLAIELKWKNMLSIDQGGAVERRRKCYEIEGKFTNDKCYIKQPSGVVCNDKTGDKNNRYCLVDELLSSMEDSGSMIFTDLINQTRKLQPVTSKQGENIPVIIRFQTNSTGHRHKFLYSKKIGEIVTQTRGDRAPAAKWGGPKNNPENKNIQGFYEKQTSKPMFGGADINDYPKIPYTVQPGGPYAKFKPLDASRWPDMPTWSKINTELNKLFKMLFSKNKILSLPSAASSSPSMDKRFLVSGFTPLALKFDNPYLEKYKAISKYFTGMPYQFIIVPLDGANVVIVDVNLNGKIMTQEEAKKEEKKIQDRLEKEKEKLAAMTPEQRKAYENSISKKIGSANVYLTDGCNHHLEAIKDILRSFGGVGDMTSYDDTKNAALREKFMTNSKTKIADNLIITMKKLMADFNILANARANNRPTDIYKYETNSEKILSKILTSNKIPSKAEVSYPLNVLNGNLKQSFRDSERVPIITYIKKILDDKYEQVSNAIKNKKPVNIFRFDGHSLDRNGARGPFIYIGHMIPTENRRGITVTNLQNIKKAQNYWQRYAIPMRKPNIRIGGKRKTRKRYR